MEIDILGIDLAMQVSSFRGSIVADRPYTGKGFS
jgi:hypothetical protein